MTMLELYCLWEKNILKRIKNIMALIRKHFIFTGRVQGVGFRYRANHTANGIGVTGWVKNCFDGSVEMEVQGTEEQINRVLVMINKGEYVMIDRIKTTVIPVVENERGFHIRSSW